MVDLRVVASALILVASACGGPAKPSPRAAEDHAAAPRAGTAPAPRRIATADTPAPGVKVDVYATALSDGTPCWTFITHGMDAKHHPELVLSVTMRRGDVAERYPADAVELLGALGDKLPESTRLDPWQSLTPSVGALGRADLTGIAAVPAMAPDGIEVPPGAVTLLLLTTEETEIARDHGAARIAAMLGRHYRFYPTAWWSIAIGPASSRAASSRRPPSPGCAASGSPASPPCSSSRRRRG